MQGKSPVVKREKKHREKQENPQGVHLTDSANHSPSMARSGCLPKTWVEARSRVAQEQTHHWNENPSQGVRVMIGLETTSEKL